MSDYLGIDLSPANAAGVVMLFRALAGIFGSLFVLAWIAEKVDTRFGFVTFNTWFAFTFCYACLLLVCHAASLLLCTALLVLSATR